MVVVVFGCFDKSRIENVINETFGKFEKRFFPKDPFLKEENHFGEDIIDYGKVEMGYMFSGFLAPGLDDEDVYVAKLASDVLGGGKSSRLYKSLYKQRHIVHAIGSTFSEQKGSGNLYISSIFEPKDLDVIKEEIEKQIENIINNGISEEELNRSKLILKADWQFSNETPYDIAETIGYWYLMGNPEFVKNYTNNLEKLTSADIVEFFKKYYSNKTISHVAVLPNIK
jgi:predicted Zn-dependent peptidase